MKSVTKSVMKIVCFGDSITQSGQGGGWTDWLQAQLGDEHEVVNKGVGGDTTLHALGRIAADVLAGAPAVVVVEFGINDCYVYLHSNISRQSASEYERNLREIMRLIIKAGARPVLVINHPLRSVPGQHEQGNGKSLQENLEPYNAVVRALSEELALPAIDFPARLSEHEAAELVTFDGVHLSASGQAIYGRVVLQALRPVLNEGEEQ